MNDFLLLKKDYRIVKYLKKLKDKILEPLLFILKKLHVTPDMMTFLGFLMIIPAFFFMYYDVKYAFVFVLVHIFFDLLDGSLARYLNKTTNYGVVNDLLGDHLFMWMYFVVLVFFREVYGFWAIFYLINYIFLVFTMALLDFKKVKYSFIFRSLYFFYFFVALKIFANIDLLTEYFVLIGVYNFISNIYLLNKIRCLKI